MIREAFRGGVGCLGWAIMALGLMGAVGLGLEAGIGPAIGIGYFSFLPGLILATICHRDKKRQVAQEKQKQDAERRAKEERVRSEREREEETARRRAEEQARRTAEEKKRREEEQKRREDEDKSRARSSERPLKDEKYYAAVLGLKGRVGPTDVKRKYRELVAQYHPDKVNHLGPKLREVADREAGR